MAPRNQPNSLEPEDTRLDVLRYVRVLWRRKYFVLLPVVFITSITAVGVRFMSPLYSSRSKLHIEPRTRVNSELERQIVDEDKRVRRKDQLSEVRTQLMNRDFLESVIRELGLQNDPSILARAKMLHDTRTPDVPTEEIAMRTLVRGLRQKLSVRAAEDKMFVVSVYDNEPESAYILAKVITRSFIDEVKSERMDKLDELFKFSSQQSRIYQEKVDAAENELRGFQAKLIRGQNSGGPINMANVGAARNQLRRMEIDEEQSERRVENARNLLRQVLDPLPDLRRMRSDREAASLERRLRAGIEDETMAEIQRAGAAGGGEVDPQGATRAALRRRFAELVETVYPSVDTFYRDKIAEYAYETADLEARRAATRTLSQMITRYQSTAEAQPEQELQLRTLQERATAARANLETFQRTLQSAELSETMLATQLAGGVSIVDPPEKPVSPLKPNRTRLTLLALILSLIGGLGTVFALEYLDKSFKDVDDVERFLGLRVVGTVPRVASGMPFGGMPVNRKRNYMLASSAVVLVMILSGMALYERLLRKQHILVPRERVQEILGGASEASEGGSAPAPANDGRNP